jgi:membrane-associated phospholipid phosphatase
MDSPALRPPGVDWLRHTGSRIRVFWPTKMIGTVLEMSAFFIGYFWLLNHTRLPVTTVPRVFIDRAISFQPWAVVFYVSLWFYVALAPALIVSWRELLSYGGATVAMSALGFGIFILWPTTIPAPDVDASLYPSLAYLKAVDASGNAFPSLHVAFAVFTAIWLARLLREMGAGGFARALNWTWCLGIVYSTVAIRQHVALDAIAGAALGAGVAAAHLRILALFPR